MTKIRRFLRRLYRNTFRKIKRNLPALIKYALSGILAIIVDYTVLYVMTEFVGLFYLVSVSISYLAAFVTNFSLNKFWTFKKKRNTIKQLSKYTLLSAFNYILTISLMYVLTSVIGIHYLISRAIIIGLVACWNFLLYKLVIYK